MSRAARAPGRWWRALPLAVAAVAAAGCPATRYHSTVNAPGLVELTPPERENGDPATYYEPADPGEHEVYAGPGIAFGPGVGRHQLSSQDTDFELAFQLRLAYSSLARSHRSRDVPFPRPGWALTLGWAPLQTRHRYPGDGTGGSDLDADIGPIYAEVERHWYPAAVGLGAAVYPDQGNGGVQMTISARPYGVRLRYMADTGFEVFAAFQLELPTALNWSK